MEIDAASKTKVEDTKEFLEGILYLPISSRFKIYIIDEVHMLSNHSFNALLKTFEEPPAYIKFILATTDFNKIPITILSRCLQFHLTAFTSNEIVDYLKLILKAEGIYFVNDALNLLGIAANGSIRDALSLLEQAIGCGAREINKESVQLILGISDEDNLLNILKGVITGNANLVLKCINDLFLKGANFVNILTQIQVMLHNALLLQITSEVMSNYTFDKRKLSMLTKDISPLDIQLYYQSALIGQRDLQYMPDQKSGLEMILLRMIAFNRVSLHGSSILK